MLKIKYLARTYFLQSKCKLNGLNLGWKTEIKITHVKFMFSKKTTKIDEIFTVDLKMY